jgi:hypothetical protein
VEVASVAVVVIVIIVVEVVVVIVVEVRASPRTGAVAVVSPLEVALAAVVANRSEGEVLVASIAPNL